LHDARRLAERAGNMPELIAALNWEGLFAVRYSTRDHTLQVRGRSLELARRVDNQSDLAWHLYELGDAYRIFGEPEKALELYEQAYANFKKIDLSLGLGYCQRAQGDIALREGRYPDALEHYREFMRYVTHDNHLWSIGQAHAKLALAHAYLGDRGEARLELARAFTQMRDWRENDLDLIAMLAEPVCLLQDGRPENAIELAAFILHHPLSWNETKQQAREILETASRGLPAEAVRSAIERGQARDLEATVAELTEKRTPRGRSIR
jgi:tetratricopeptide (TPR) repeat protein